MELPNQQRWERITMKAQGFRPVGDAANGALHTIIIRALAYWRGRAEDQSLLQEERDHAADEVRRWMAVSCPETGCA
jgi:hypothetical protein